jgi:feruloyl esterase
LRPWLSRSNSVLLKAAIILHSIGMRFSLLLAVGATAAHAYAHGEVDKRGSFQAKCESFAHKLKIQDATIHSVTHVPAGTNISMSNVPAVCAGNADSTSSTFEFCRVSLNVTTSPKSQIFMEAWLPSNYSGRFLSTGNGGLGGCMSLPTHL